MYLYARDPRAELAFFALAAAQRDVTAADTARLEDLTQELRDSPTGRYVQALFALRAGDPNAAAEHFPAAAPQQDVTTGCAASAWTLVGALGSMSRGTWARRRGRATPQRPVSPHVDRPERAARHVSSTADQGPCHLSVDPGRVTQVHAAWNMGPATWSSHAAETQCQPTSTGLGEPPGT